MSADTVSTKTRVLFICTISCNWLFNLCYCILPSPLSHTQTHQKARGRNISSEMQLHAVKINTRYYDNRARSKPHFNQKSIHWKINQKQWASKRSGWEMPLATWAGHEDKAQAFPAPRNSTDTPNPSAGEGRGKVGTRDSLPRGCGGTQEGTILPSPPTQKSFHLSSDTKENLLLERHGSFLAPTQILLSGILEPLRPLKAVLFPCYHTKPSQNGALLFTVLPQPCQEGITECDPYFIHAEDALTALIQLPCMSTVPTRKRLHPPLSAVLDTAAGSRWRVRTATHMFLQQKHAFLESHSQVTINPKVS